MFTFDIDQKFIIVAYSQNLELKNKSLTVQFFVTLSGGVVIPFTLEVKYVVSGPRFAKSGSSMATLTGTASDANWYFELPPIVAADQ